MYATTGAALPAVPFPNPWFAGVVVVVACFVFATWLLFVLNPGDDAPTNLAARARRGVAAVALCVAIVGVHVAWLTWFGIRIDEYNDAVIDAVEAHWDLTYIDGPIRHSGSTWTAISEGETVECVTTFTDTLDVVCSAPVPPPTRN